MHVASPIQLRLISAPYFCGASLHSTLRKLRSTATRPPGQSLPCLRPRSQRLSGTKTNARLLSREHHRIIWAAGRFSSNIPALPKGSSFRLARLIPVSHLAWSPISKLLRPMISGEAGQRPANRPSKAVTRQAVAREPGGSCKVRQTEGQYDRDSLLEQECPMTPHHNEKKIY